MDAQFKSFMEGKQVVGKESTRRRPTRPPRSRHFGAIPTGPRLYAQDEKQNSIYWQFFVPPPGFITFTNSRSEWTIYVAISKVLGWPRDPRQGPYIGWPGLWTYQSPFEGGRAARGGQWREARCRMGTCGRARGAFRR